MSLLTMDVFRALADFSAENHSSSALDMRKGELFEVIDAEADRPSHDWWGVRRLEDNAVGFAPAKYLKFEQKMARVATPDEDDDADDMEKEAELPGTVVSVPVPDYSDEEDSGNGEGGKEQGRKKDIKARLDSLLTPDEWEKIVISAEGEEEVPEPDYESGEVANGSGAERGTALVGPKKLPNPVLQSKDHQRIHKELLMNQKFGIDVLHRKTELKKELDKRKDAIKKKELEEYQRQKRTSFEEKLEEQANKLKLTEPRPQSIPEEPKVQENEFLRVHSKISRTKTS